MDVFLIFDVCLKHPIERLGPETVFDLLYMEMRDVRLNNRINRPSIGSQVHTTFSKAEAGHHLRCSFKKYGRRISSRANSHYTHPLERR